MLKESIVGAPALNQPSGFMNEPEHSVSYNKLHSLLPTLLIIWRTIDVEL